MQYLWQESKSRGQLPSEKILNLGASESTKTLLKTRSQSGFFWLYWQQIRGEVARNSIKGTFRSLMSQMKEAMGISSDMPPRKNSAPATKPHHTTPNNHQRMSNIQMLGRQHAHCHVLHVWFVSGKSMREINNDCASEGTKKKNTHKPCDGRVAWKRNKTHITQPGDEGDDH